MLRTHREGKDMGGGERVWLRLNSAGGAQECLWLWRAEDQVQDPSSFTRSERAGEMLGMFSPSSDPRGLLPIVLSSSSPTPFLLCS